LTAMIHFHKTKWTVSLLVTMTLVSTFDECWDNVLGFCWGALPFLHCQTKPKNKIISLGWRGWVTLPAKTLRVSVHRSQFWTVWLQSFFWSLPSWKDSSIRALCPMERFQRRPPTSRIDFMITAQTTLAKWVGVLQNTGRICNHIHRIHTQTEPDNRWFALKSHFSPCLKRNTTETLSQRFCRSIPSCFCLLHRRRDLLRRSLQMIRNWLTCRLAAYDYQELAQWRPRNEGDWKRNRNSRSRLGSSWIWSTNHRISHWFPNSMKGKSPSQDFPTASCLKWGNCEFKCVIEGWNPN
jgi:hypothetical protein